MDVQPARPLHAPDAPPLILASASPARARLLADAGLAFAIRPAAVDEEEMRRSLRAAGVSALDAAVALAETKARRVAAGASADAIVIGADQILDLDGAWLDKPGERARARAQLLALRGRRHELLTAVVVFRGGSRIWHEAARVRLWMREISDAFIDAYLDAAGPVVTACVGGYQIEALGAQLFARVEGDHHAVQGLPLLPLLECLRNQEVLLR